MNRIQLLEILGKPPPRQLIPRNSCNRPIPLWQNSVETFLDPDRDIGIFKGIFTVAGSAAKSVCC